MAIKQENHIFKGMQRDLAVSKFSPEFYFDAHNIRLTARENSTLLSITNEKGNKEVELKNIQRDTVSIEGEVLGYCVLNTYLILFTIGEKDYIYRLEKKEDYFEVFVLFEGDLNFDRNFPIETLGSYETQDIQKVYWVDGKNTARVINIITDSQYTDKNLFNFIRPLTPANIKGVEKLNINGSFPSGVIQYAISYYTKHLQESSIFYISPIYYIAFEDRAASPEEKVSCSFKITINNFDKSFDGINIYSIIRTSENATPEVKKVTSLSIKDVDEISYIDNGTYGEAVDPTELLYKGGEEIIPYTITQKDNTLFLGNLVINRQGINKDIRDKIQEITITQRQKDSTVFEEEDSENDLYPYKNQLKYSRNQITFLCRGERYRLGIVAQHKTGKWSEALYVKDYLVENSYDEDGYENPFVEALGTVNADIVNKLLDNDYVRIKPVIVYPNVVERNVLCQGILCPTLYTKDDRTTGQTYSLSSWIARAKPRFSTSAEERKTAAYNSLPGQGIPQFVDKEPLFTNDRLSAEIQSQHLESEDTTTNYVVDENILDFYSPDIEFDTDLRTQLTKAKMRFVGFAKCTSRWFSNSIQAGSFYRNEYSLDVNYREINANSIFSNNSTSAWKVALTLPFWVDGAIFTKIPETVVNYISTGYLVYPWHRDTSLNNDYARDGRTAVISKKIWANYRYAKTAYSKFWEEQDPVYDSNINEGGIEDVLVYDSTEDSIAFLSDNNIYRGNYNGVHTTGTEYPIKGAFVRYNEILSDFQYINASGKDISTIKFDELEVIVNITNTSKDIVPIKFKSCPHAVIQFKGKSNDLGDDQRRILPSIYNTGRTDLNNTVQGNVDDPFIKENEGGFILAELYQDETDNKFGGISEEAFINNSWLSAGNSVPLIRDNEATIVYEEGDTYYQRYDCLDTYPHSDSDKQSMIDIVSFRCISRINLDGKYDKNRDKRNNIGVSPTNFNLYNSVYSQKDNFFSYSYLPLDTIKTSQFPNMLTWTKSKIVGSDIDNWTNVTLASTLDLEGDKGKLTSLKYYRNNIIAFQDKAINTILFNSRVQLPVSDGVPVEIASNYQVEGKRMISNTVGCTNKWSIVETPSGLYFVDDIGNGLYSMTDGLNNLTQNKGFFEWISKNINPSKPWTLDYPNIKAHYDFSNGDVYFTTKDTSLCYSEILNQFTSFMNYENVPFMFNVEGDFYSIKNNKLWKHFEGDYNMFYGEYKPFDITILSNQNPTEDKIFHTVEFRGDSWNNDTLLSTSCIDTLNAWNEYQHGEMLLTNIPNKISPIKRKFRIWRAIIPRNNKGINGIPSNPLDRIRNPWAYIKLSRNKENTDRIQLHDIVIKYTV